MRNPSILDLCSGKGGDLKKWLRKEHMPCHYVGFELSQSATEEAKRRYEGIYDNNVPSIFIIGDVGDPNNTIDKLLQNEKFKDIRQEVRFDIVSCQFSMHYLLESEEKLRAFLHNVSCRLEPEGFFVGTTIDAERVVSKIRTEGGPNMRIGNSCY